MKFVIPKFAKSYLVLDYRWDYLLAILLSGKSLFNEVIGMDVCG